MPLTDASMMALKEIFLLFEKKVKNKKKKKATIPNLIESEKKGVALSTMILLVIKAEDQSKIKISGIILLIFHYLSSNSFVKSPSLFNLMFKLKSFFEDTLNVRCI